MKIIVKHQEHNIRLRLPTWLMLNRVTALTLPEMLRKYGIAVSYRQIVTFLKALNHYRRRHWDWNLVEAELSDGGHILVKL